MLSIRKAALPFALLGLFSVTAQGAVFNLYNDFSDVSNPNGVWTYEQKPGTVLATHVADWDTSRNIWQNAQPGWAPGNESQPGNFLPFVGKDVNNVAQPGVDAPSGHVYVHNNDPANSPPGFGTFPLAISWTAPSTGIVTITGDLWEAQRSLGRSEDWSLNRNGVVFTGGTMTPSNNTSASPLSFASGSGGVGSLTLVVNAGDVIEFQLQRSAGTVFGTTTGLDWNLVLTPPNPEPSSVVLLGAGGVVFAAVGLRRRRAMAR
jgi:hypothetical protein